MKKARLLALDVIGRTGLHEIMCDDLQDYYDALKCDCFDLTVRKIGVDGDCKKFDIFCDDMGLFVDRPIPSAFDENMKPALVGNLIFANHEGADTTSLTDDDIELIKRHVVHIINVDDPKDDIDGWLAVFPVSY